MPGSLIGPRLLGDIRKTISVVQGEFGKEDVVKIPTAIGVGGGGGVRLCEFTGAWAINAQKTVNIKGNTSATVVATNIFLPNIAHLVAKRDCLVSNGILVTARC